MGKQALAQYRAWKATQPSTHRFAVELVARGLSYSEAATCLHLTKGQVAGACHRAGLVTGRRGGKRGPRKRVLIPREEATL